MVTLCLAVSPAVSSALEVDCSNPELSPLERSECSYFKGLRAFQEALQAVRSGDQDLSQKRYAEAAGYFRESRGESPSYYLGTYYLGVSLGKLKRFDEAIPFLGETVAMLERAPLRRPALVPAYRDLAAALYHEGEYEEASKYLKKAQALEPRNALVHFDLGLCQYGLGDPDAGEAALERAVGLDPLLAPRAEFQKGRNYLDRERIREAEEAFKTAALTTTDAGLSNAANDLLAAISRRRESSRRAAEKFWQIRASIGGRFDSNVVLEPETGTTLSRATGKDDFGTTFSAGGGLAWRAKAARGHVRFDYDFQQTLNADITDFNLQAHRPRVEAAWRPHPSLTLGVRGGGNLYRLGGRDYLNQFYIEPLAGFFSKSWAYTQFSYLIADQNFKVDFFDPARDGILQDIHVRQYFMLGELSRRVFAGYRHLRETPDASGTDFERRGNELEGGVRFAVHGDSTVQVSYRFRNDDYRNPNTLDPLNRRRNDDIHEIRVGFERPLNSLLTLRLGYQGRINNSNVSVFQYRRHIGLLALDLVF